jgi:hypothetical protein
MYAVVKQIDHRYKNVMCSKNSLLKINLILAQKRIIILNDILDKSMLFS